MSEYLKQEATKAGSPLRGAGVDAPAFDSARWQARLDELLAAHHVPGAALAVVSDGAVHELASGVLHTGTRVAVSTDSVFQIGSISKGYTATLVVLLAHAGKLDLDAPVTDVLPDFAVADAEATKTVTPRQLLNHTSGIEGDFVSDTGRGDDCLARYVEGVRDVGLTNPPGATMSYSSTAYNILGRIVEVVTGRTWDEALKEMLCVPLGLAHTMTLPEEVLRFRAAMGHMGEPGEDPVPTPLWNMLPRSAGPYGGICATAGDVARFARLFVDGGRTPDGSQVLAAETVEAMLSRQVEMPDQWSLGAHWGLGWGLFEWDGVRGFGHDGSTFGQLAYLRALPEAGIAVALLTNGGAAAPKAFETLCRELTAELAGVGMPEFGPAAEEPAVDPAPFVGSYRREGFLMTVTDRPAGEGVLRVKYEGADGLKDTFEPLFWNLVPVSDAPSKTVFAGRRNEKDGWIPVVFYALADGSRYVHFGVRATAQSG
ncbi:beta-lactamase family protein [Streptomyces sp. Je 1-4]|uniref:serine hydrolase domain-containing protein n=1 Tax=Streptomyces TaxID=1883 RepID=UPI0021DAB588|nr:MULTISPECIES: serine hydrolase domain-containing protein [unclassified Streptomyces]UYB41154.1 beta-lactamase family protein [Streptomyces sp. Je 1-4]UZQ37327.1 beta-lactamase family protein [Streptomyces sp. Je 1-4] [Streptomyces sp. Je 1-4 4N24]UZQ44744.1 beta-lactamase family protein [Streptomyces sp. Je 1-4] [Streptomyces sp. Je 1-4 4N24_ara]